MDKRDKARVVKRLVGNPMRGSGEKAQLQLGDILIANRGSYKVSNMLGIENGKEVWDGAPVFAGATVLVVRAKKQADEHWPYRLHALLDSPQVKDYLQKRSAHKVDQPWVITKADLESLPLPDNFARLHPYFHSGSREKLVQLEKLDESLSKLRHARVKAKIWREFHAPELKRREELADEVLRAIPGFGDLSREMDEVREKIFLRRIEINNEYPNQPQRLNDEPIINKLNENYNALAENRRALATSFIKDLFVAVLQGGKDLEGPQAPVCEAIRKSHGCELGWGPFPEFQKAKQLLANEVATINAMHSSIQTTADRMMPSVMALMGKLASRFDSVVVLNPDIGHLPAAIASEQGAPAQAFCLTTSDDRDLTSFAKAYVQLFSARTIPVSGDIEGFIKVARSSAEFMPTYKAVIADAGHIGHHKFTEVLKKIAPALAENATCLAYVPPGSFDRIVPMLNKLISVTVLPPLPANTNEPVTGKLVQGLVVEIAINGQPGRMVTIFDATNAVPDQKVGLDLSEELVAEVAKALNEEVPADGVERFTVSREKFATFKSWPGLFTLKGISSYDHLASMTLESIEDEMARLKNEREQLQDSMARDDKFGWIVQDNHVKET
jgi:hypothetical protein